jgi:hypothetical protein
MNENKINTIKYTYANVISTNYKLLCGLRVLLGPAVRNNWKHSRNILKTKFLLRSLGPNAD